MTLAHADASVKLRSLRLQWIDCTGETSGYRDSGWGINVSRLGTEERGQVDSSMNSFRVSDGPGGMHLSQLAVGTDTNCCMQQLTMVETWIAPAAGDPRRR